MLIILLINYGGGPLSQQNIKKIMISSIINIEMVFCDIKPNNVRSDCLITVSKRPLTLIVLL